MRLWLHLNKLLRTTEQPNFEYSNKIIIATADDNTRWKYLFNFMVNLLGALLAHFDAPFNVFVHCLYMYTSSMIFTFLFLSISLCICICEYIWFMYMIVAFLRPFLFSRLLNYVQPIGVRASVSIPHTVAFSWMNRFVVRVLCVLCAIPGFSFAFFFVLCVFFLGCGSPFISLEILTDEFAFIKKIIFY